MSRYILDVYDTVLFMDGSKNNVSATLQKKYRAKYVFFVDFKSSVAHLTFKKADFTQKMVYI